MTSSEIHWDAVWQSKRPDEVSWYQPEARTSLDLIVRLVPDRAAPIIDAGGGASRLVDALLDANFTNVTVLDIAAAALEAAKVRLAEASARVRWIAENALDHRPAQPYRLWHDRAMFHFLRSSDDIAGYRATLESSIASGGYAVIGTFAPDGPQRCSNLDVTRYDASAIRAAVGELFTLCEEHNEVHRTPWGAEQRFRWFVLRRA